MLILFACLFGPSRSSRDVILRTVTEMFLMLNFRPINVLLTFIVVLFVPFTARCAEQFLPMNRCSMTILFALGVTQVISRFAMNET